MKTPRTPRPFFRSKLQCWYLKIGKKFHRLGKGPEDAPPPEVLKRYHEIMADRPAVAADGTVAELCRKFLAWVETERPKSLKWYRMFVSSFRKFIGEQLTLSKLETHHIDEWVSERYAGKSAACRAGAVAAVSRVFAWGIKKGHHKGNNPAKNAERPRVNPRGNEAYLSDEKIEKILKAIDDSDPFKSLVYALLYTGARPQEVRLVEARHVDLTGKIWVFSAEEAKCGNKTGKERVIHLDPNALAVTERALLKTGKEGRLFRNRKGGPFTLAWINSKFRRISQKIKFRVTAYFFRHTWVTNALLNDVSPQKVAELAGHSVKMTLGIYSHLHMRQDVMKDALAQATRKVPSAKREDVA